jgi:hypothetical protein
MTLEGLDILKIYLRIKLLRARVKLPLDRITNIENLVLDLKTKKIKKL